MSNTYTIKLTEGDCFILLALLEPFAKHLVEYGSPVPPELTKLHGEHPATSLLRIAERVRGQLTKQGIKVND